MKTVLKLSVGLSLILILLGLYGYFHIKNSWKSFTSESILIKLTKEIKNAEPLPELFYALYNTEYPNCFKYNHRRHLINSLFIDEYSSPPSHNVARLIGHSIKTTINSEKQRRDFLFYPYSLTWEIEKSTNQYECLNWLARNCDLVYNKKGIEDAAIFFYKDTLTDLDSIEMASMVLMMKNPAFYDPIRRPEFVKEKSLKLIEKLRNIE
ncbi:transglycosylase domain-containing protein [Carboxylicivirga sp. RSCT41]|uniref:transglycosylase domain-containing protein n=1 Tax=Carboxylicivirga agarovorans TaxID=3417570 RepID=UPI003D32CA46